MRRFLRRAPAAALLALILAVNPGCDRQRQARMTGRGRDMRGVSRRVRGQAALGLVTQGRA